MEDAAAAGNNFSSSQSRVGYRSEMRREHPFNYSILSFIHINVPSTFQSFSLFAMLQPTSLRLNWAKNSNVQLQFLC
jgi:hypothetical protein